MNADEILEFLDSRQEALLWLSNDGRQHLADARLSVFRSESDWAVFVELPHYQAQIGDFSPWVGAVGTCWEDGIAPYGTAEEGLLLTEDPAQPLWKYGVGSEPWHTWLGDRAGFSVILNGTPRAFAPSVQDYAEAGIIFPNTKSGPGSLPPGYLLRFLCHHLNHPFFASEAVLRNALGQCRDLPLLLQASLWHHPKFLVVGEDDFFSDDYICNIPCFQVLSRAIVLGDLTEWQAQDPKTFNTDWPSLEAIRAECNAFHETQF